MKQSLVKLQGRPRDPGSGQARPLRRSHHAAHRALGERRRLGARRQQRRIKPPFSEGSGFTVCSYKYCSFNLMVWVK